MRTRSGANTPSRPGRIETDRAGAGSRARFRSVAAVAATTVCVLAVSLALAGCAVRGGGGGGATTARDSAAGSGAVPTAVATVERVVDGDTAIVHVSERRERVRFIGINAPEDTSRVDPFGPEATAYVKRALAPGSTVYLEQDAEQRDRYGRLLSYVWLARPATGSDAEMRRSMLNARIALDGYAQQMTVPPNVKYERRFRTYVREARLAGRGLWAGRAAGPRP